MSYFTHKRIQLGLGTNTPGGIVFEAMTTEQPQLIYAAMGLALTAITEHLKCQNVPADECIKIVRDLAKCKLFADARHIAQVCTP